MANETPLFSWSMSRERMLNDCELCYGLWYYESHKGWLQSSPVLARTAYRWKNSVALKDFMVNRINEHIYNHLYLIRISEAEMNKSIRSNLNHAFKTSLEHVDKWYKQPKQNLMIRELVGKDQYDKTMVRSVAEKLDGYIHQFYEGVTNREALSDDAELLFFKPDTKAGIPNFTVPELGDLLVYVGMQTTYRRRSDGKVISVVYKCDSQPSSESQIGTMALYLHKALRVPIEDIIIRDEFLTDGHIAEYQMDQAFIDETVEALADSVAHMKTLVTDGDLSVNKHIPLEQFGRTHRHMDQTIEDTHCALCELVRRDLERNPQGLYQSYKQKHVS